MKLFVTFSALLAVASASHLYFAPRFIAPAASSSQYHSQDGIGQYTYGYNDHLSTKQEIKSLDGTTRGSYSYVDSNSELQTVDYVADAGGFRVAATNLPKAPIALATELPKQIEDTAEVSAAKSAHFAAIEQAKVQFGEVERASKLRAASMSGELPKQVEDTLEVKAAKAAHFAAIEEAKKQNVVLIQAPIELPEQVKDTPEVAKAKAEYLIAIEHAKLGNRISLIQNAPLIAPVQFSGYSTLPLTRGFSYSSSTLNTPVISYGAAYAPYLNSQVGW